MELSVLPFSQYPDWLTNAEKVPVLKHPSSIDNSVERVNLDDSVGYLAQPFMEYELRDVIMAMLTER